MIFEEYKYLIVFVAGAIFGTVQIFVAVFVVFLAVLIMRTSNKKGPLIKNLFPKKKKVEPTYTDAERARLQNDAGKIVK